MMSLDDDNISAVSFAAYVLIGMGLVMLICMIPS